MSDEMLEQQKQHYTRMLSGSYAGGVVGLSYSVYQPWQALVLQDMPLIDLQSSITK
jgi:hypothetical protein